MMADASLLRVGDRPAKDYASNIVADDGRAAPIKIASIQYLRALAALSVSLYHTLNIVQYLENRHIAYFYILSSGVDLFFCISGYIIWTTNWCKPVSPLQFTWNRLTRVVPLYWVFTGLAAIVSFFSNPESTSLSVHAIVFSLLMVPYSSWKMWPILGVGWTLNYEMFFYAVFAILMMVAPRKNLFITVLSFMAAMVVLGQSVEFKQPALIVYTGSMLTEFMFGMIIGRISTSGYLPRSRMIGIGFIVLGVAAMLVASPTYEADLKFRPSVWGLPCALILVGTLTMSAAGKGANPVSAWRPPRRLVLCLLPQPCFCHHRNDSRPEISPASQRHRLRNLHDRNLSARRLIWDFDASLHRIAVTESAEKQERHEPLVVTLVVTV